jgi:hypothetical protein
VAGERRGLMLLRVSFNFFGGTTGIGKIVVVFKILAG